MPNYHPVERSFFYGGDMKKHIQIISRKIAKKIGMTYYFTGIPCKHGHISTRNAKSCACHECVSEYNQKWYKLNKDRAYSRQRRWVLENTERHRYLLRRSADASRERGRDEYNLYMRSVNSSRRKKLASGDSFGEMTEWIKYQAKACFYCGDYCENEFHIDHFVPISRGGPHKISNLVISCPTCNMRKGSMMPYHFIGISYGWALVS